MIGVIVAYDKNHVIGNQGRIPWQIKGEQKRFKTLTTGNVVVMGRKSYEEIGKPLPNRTTIIVSRTLRVKEKDCLTASSLPEAIRLAGDRDIYIAGGGRLYEEAIDLVDQMFVTEIDAEFEGDTYFPQFDESKFRKEINQTVEGVMPYTYVTYTRIRREADGKLP